MVPSTPIAIIAMGALFPGRGTTHGFFRDIAEGRDLLTDVPSSHWQIEDYYDPDPKAPDRTYGRRGAFLSPQAFDPVAHGLPPAALPGTDSAQLLSLLVADKIMRDVEAVRTRPIDRSMTSVVLGVASATELTAHMAGRLQRPVWEKVLREAGLPETEVARLSDRMAEHYTPWTEAVFPGLLGNVVAGRIANRLDLGGSNYVTDAACASSLAALQIALHELRTGRSDMVFAGGADTLNDILMYMCFSKTPALSPTGDCRPFSADADGTMLGEGIGMVALRRLDDAERDGDRIHAVIRGLGGGSDGRATAIYAPRAGGQARALARAYDDAGYGPETVELVEAHGTGTVAGDKAELEGLTSVFAPDGEIGAAWCALGSVKSQIGHTKAAAGAASLVKIAMALGHRVLPPTCKVSAPAPALSGKTPFYLNTAARPWVRGRDHPRRASVSSFGFGGSNFHATLEEYRGPARAVPERLLPAEVLLFSADSDEALVARIEQTLAKATHEDVLAHLADASHLAFDREATIRASLTASSIEALAELAGKLVAAIRDGSAASRPLPAEIAYQAGPARGGKLTFLFSGQGSQYVGMGADLAMAFPEALEVWDQAADDPAVGPLNLHDIAFPPRAFSEAEAGEHTARLTAMEHAQPAIAAVALSHLALLDKAGLKADMAGGHSFGELVALHYGGAIPRRTVLALAHARGRAMADAAAASPGAMLAVQASAADLKPWLKAHSEIVLANDNAPDQVALSGATGAIEAIEADLAGAGFTTKRLPVASAFHSSIVAGAIQPFGNALAEAALRSARLPIFANATAAPYPASAGKIVGQLARQIGEPVRFREMVEAMYAAGARTFVEIGPGNVLGGLVAKTLAGEDVLTVSLDHKRANGTTATLAALARLTVTGHDVDFTALFEGMPAPPAPPPRPKFAVDIDGANYAKPYPPRDGGPVPEAQPTTRTTAQPAPTPSPSPPPVESEDIPMPNARSPEELAQMQRLLAEITEAHTTYLNLAAQMLNGAAPAAGTTLTAPAPTSALPAPQPPAPPAAAPAPITAPSPRSVAPAAQPAPSAPLNGARANGGDPAGHEAPPQAALAPQPEPPKPAVTPAINAGDASAAVIAIVAEKTGYPTDMLEPDMDLEAELGVDSIKQVEILSALRERFPSLPEIEPEQIADLSSIASIAAFIDAHLGVAPTAPAPIAATATQAPLPAPTPVASSEPTMAPAANGSLAGVLKDLIAEKTGYPTDMLEDDMDLESELGVDSIKQVEILSALREAHPGLPEIEPEQVAELRTIRQLADFFG